MAAQQWWVHWSHTGGKWSGKVQGPWPPNQAPIGDINVGGKVYPAWSGPFSTQAAAQAIAKAAQGPAALSGPILPGGLSVPGNPLAGIAEVGAVLKSAFLAITDISLWRSLLYIALGAALLFAGARLWLGKPLLPKPPPIVPIPL